MPIQSLRIQRRRWTASSQRAALFLAVLVAIGGSVGCAAVPYRSGAVEQYYVSEDLAPLTQPQIERGEPRPVIDTIGWIVGIPSKIILWDRRVENHKIGDDTEAAIARYLAVNELDTVKVRLNEYAPGDEWRRLRANRSVGWGWRYTAGTLSWLGYTLLPGRVFGGDHYNAYTNTINLYSDVPAIAVHEGGHAKDFARRKYKGTYAIVYALPAAPLWYEAVASRDALAYLHEHGTIEAEQEGYRILTPAYGTYVGDAVSQFVPWNGTLVYAAAVVPGHVIGRIQARRVAQWRVPRRSPLEETPDQHGFEHSNPDRSALERPFLERPSLERLPESGP